MSTLWVGDLCPLVAHTEGNDVTIPDDMKAHNAQLIAQFRAAGRRLDNRPLLLLTTTGARSGKLHTAPMMYVADGDRLLVIASNAGAPRHPDWYRNLLANPRVTVEVEGETFPAEATPLLGEERDRVFDAITRDYPFFRDHQAGVSRKIPVVALRRAT
ncbi:MAG: nitroreductase family deazaflavin-dependent oxidoreductase [Thermomicrobiales bacterium]|nr:nitroreductase family deazaflavin-dependent oxidoreductase [Thermomicrobiales bacterium]